MVPVGLILAGAQLGMGAYQYFKGKSEAANLRRPIYQVPSEVKQNLTDAQLRALEGLPEEQKKAYVSQIQQAAGAQINRAKDLKSGLVGMAGVYQSQQNAYQNLLGQDAAAKQANQNQLMQVRGQMAQYKDKAFQVNQMEPYKQQFNQAQAMQGAGLQNMMGAAQAGASAYDSSVANKNYLEYLKTVNQLPPPPGIGIGMAGIGAGARLSGLNQAGNSEFTKYTSPEIPVNTVQSQDQWLQAQQAQDVGFNNMYGPGQNYDPNFLGNINPGPPLNIQPPVKYSFPKMPLGNYNVY